MGWGAGRERRGTQLPMWPGWNLRNTYIWNSALVTIMGTEGHTQVGHPDSSYLQLQSPKESCYVFIMENNYGSQWWKSLGEQKGKWVLDKRSSPFSEKWKQTVQIMSSNISAVCTQALTPPETSIASVSCLPPKTRRRQRGNPKTSSSSAKEWFCWVVQNNSPWLSSIIKGLGSFVFDLFWMYKGRKETHFKGFASGPDFRP